MSTLSSLVDFLVAHGPTLLAGVTLVLLAGCLAMRCCRHPVARRQLGVLTAIASGGYLLVAALPLPRWTPPTKAIGLAAAQPQIPAMAVGSPAPLEPEQRLAGLLAAIERLEPAATTPAVPLAAEPKFASPPPAAAPIAWERLAAVAYLGLALLLLLRALFGLWRLGSVLRAGRTGPADLVAAAGLPKGTRLCIADRPVRPFCSGVLRPVVVLPATLMAPARRNQALAVLRHEAAHLRARDPLLQLLLAALSVPLGLHPLFWWLQRDVRFHSELIADDAAAATAGAVSYARELLLLAERHEPALAAVGTVPVFHRPSEFFRRIQMLLQRQGRLSPSPSRARRALHTLVAATLVAAAGSLFGVPLAAQDPKPAPAELRDQNERLRAELDLLRAELGELRVQLNQGAKGPTELRVTELLHEKGFGSASDLAATEALRTYRVREGDSLESIARRELGGATRAQLMQHNPGVEWTRLKVGQNLVLPPRAGSANSLVPPPENSSSDARNQQPNDLESGIQKVAKALEFAMEGRPPRTIPVLQDIPVTTTRFFQADENGLPSRAVDLVPVDLAPSERTTTTTEAIADLASRYLDLQGEIEIAEATASIAQDLYAAGRSSTMEAKRATLQVATLKRKFAIVQRLLDGEIQATESELVWLDQKRKAANQTDALRVDMQMQRAKVRLDALRATK